jgi:sugar lactone lactonase YvrE
MVRNALFSAISWLSIFLAVTASPVVRANTPSASSVKVVHQFPNGTWLENLAIRANGGVLLSDLAAPELIYVDPFAVNPSSSIVHTFPSPATGLVGIAELGTDIFYVVTIEFSFATVSATPGSGQVWRVDMSHYPSSAPVTLVANLPGSTQPNGVTALASGNKILIADYVQGVIWRVDATSGAVDIASKDPALASSGVNGIHAPGNGFIYFTNTGASTYGKLPIDSTGTITGSATIIFHNTTVSPDDFALYPHGGSNAAFLMDGTDNRVVYTTGSGDSYTTIATIQGPTAAAFGRRSGDTSSLYVASTGGDFDYGQSPVPVGGRLTKIVIQD